MNQPDETIKIKLKPAALRSMAKMMYKMGAAEARSDDAHNNEIEAAENTIQSMEREIARLQQQVEKHEETIAVVKRDRDELLAAVIAVAVDLKMPRNDSQTSNDAEMGLFWLRVEVAHRLVYLSDEAPKNDVEKAPEQY